MGQYPEVTWPADYTELTTIEELLRCKICYEYVETCVVTPCSHNYCSICIRKFLHYKTQCPACCANLYDKDLRPNRIVDQISTSYLSLKAKLVACIKGAEVKRHYYPTDQDTPATPKKPPDPDAAVSPAIAPRRNVAAPRAGERTPKIDTLFGRNAEKAGPETSVKKVPCPVCGVEIFESRVDRHVDDCLRRQKSTPASKAVGSSLEPLPKYVTNLMKDAELRRVLKKYGLSAAGARKILEKRLQRFSVVYNAERDKPAQKPLCDLVRRCEEEEAAEKSVPRRNTSDHLQAIDRKTDAKVVEEIRKQYLERNREEYRRLVDSINEREKLVKNRARSLFVKTDEECAAGTSTACQETGRIIFHAGDAPNSSETDVDRCSPSDTDSNATCPLQRYSNEDPAVFLTLEISTDSSDDSPVKLEKCSPATERGANVSSSPVLNSDSIEKAGPSPRGVSSSPITPKGKVEASKSNSDIFDASTEDNWSESNRGNADQASNEAKRFARKVRVKRSKRTKRRSDDRSSDSETDVEFGPGSAAGRKCGKIRRGRGRKSKIETAEPIDNGRLSPESTPRDSPGIAITDKENVDTQPAIARRSSRHRNPVCYARNSRSNARVSERREKSEEMLEEQRLNVVDPTGTRDGEPELETDRSSNEAKKPLRKRRKTVKR